MALTKTRLQKTSCKPQTCPSCGGLGCMERPRYFCGQLLTDRDLDAAQRYVIEKNRLHNRYLVGTGVVCGLAVHCDPCDGVVVIEPGYAIDCCGNDIVVCDPYRFDVINYIDSCFRGEEPGCDGKIRVRPPTNCDKLPKEYCLRISYNEENSRPVTAMGQGGNCSTGRCEPSRTTEIFRIDVEERQPRKLDRLGGFWGNVVDCFGEVWPRMRGFVHEISATAERDDSQENIHRSLYQIFCQMKKYVLELYADGPQVHCNLAARLDELDNNFPNFPQDQNPDPQRFTDYQVRRTQAMFTMLAWIPRYWIDCLCEAMLTPCVPCEQEDEGVLLACVSICDGRIEDICNTVRTQVISAVSIQQYLQPLLGQLSQQLERLCCEFDPASLTRGLARQQVSFRNLDASFERAEAAVEMAQGYIEKALRGFNLGSVFHTSGSQMISAVDLYNRPVNEARATLEQMNVAVVERQAATFGEAYDLRHLSNLDWSAAPGSQVELVVDPEGRVAGMRLLKKE